MSIYRLGTYRSGQRRLRTFLVLLLLAIAVATTGGYAQQRSSTLTQEAPPHLAGPHDDFGG